MTYNTKTIKIDGGTPTARPIPQHFNPTADDYEPVYGRNNAMRVEIYGPDGNPISTASSKLSVRASEIETLLTAISGYVDGLEGKDYATQTTLAAILAKISSDPATQTTLAAILTQLNTTGLKKIIDALPAGANILGKVGIDQTAPGTTNAVAIPTGSVSSAFAITPNDTNNLAQTTTTLFVGGDGNIKVNLAGTGIAIIFKGLIAGVFYPIRATRVYATDTTATDIVGVY
ncbi:MAG: hypothetical protein VB084_06420 [Syntrophomonadaceae bacterium]|nr:hypothetical protein [Syntrophomonadaceae bacterium]